MYGKCDPSGPGQNKHVDSLATLASAMTEDVPWLINVELLMEPSINTTTDVSVTRVSVAVISTTGSCWMDPIIDFLAKDRVSDNEKEANRVRQIAFWYWLSADRKLYRRAIPFVLTPRESKQTLGRAT